MNVGFIGLGNMGAPIPANLVRAGHRVTVWNRSAEKTRRLVALGAIEAQSPRAAASESRTVITMLADDAALESVLAGPQGLLEGLALDPLSGVWKRSSDTAVNYLMAARMLGA